MPRSCSSFVSKCTFGGGGGEVQHVIDNNSNCLCVLYVAVRVLTTLHIPAHLICSAARSRYCY